MERSQIYTSKEEKQKQISIITQKIIHCDDWIMKCHNEPTLRFIWEQKKERFEYELQDLKTEDLI